MLTIARFLSYSDEYSDDLLDPLTLPKDYMDQLGGYQLIGMLKKNHKNSQVPIIRNIVCCINTKL